MNAITVARLTMNVKNRADGLEHFITWPVVDERDHAVLVKASGGDLWLQKRVVNAALPVKFCDYEYGTDKVASRIVEAVDEITKHKDAALVEVAGKGPGKTEKSAKVAVRLLDLSAPRAYNQPCPLTRAVAFLIPASLVTERDGKLLAPRWVLVEKLEKSSHKNRQVAIPAGRWPGLDALRAEVLAAFDSLLVEKTGTEAVAERESAEKSLAARNEELARLAAQLADESCNGFKRQIAEKRRADAIKKRDDAIRILSAPRIETGAARQAQKA